MWPEYNYTPILWLKKIGQVWHVFQEGKSVFHGTKTACEALVNQ